MTSALEAISAKMGKKISLKETWLPVPNASPLVNRHGLVAKNQTFLGTYAIMVKEH